MTVLKYLQIINICKYLLYYKYYLINRDKKLKNEIS